MTPEEYKKTVDKYHEVISTCDELRHVLIETLLKQKYIRAQLFVHNLQNKIDGGKKFYFKWYGNMSIIENVVDAVNPLTKVKVEDLSIQKTETFNAEIKVEYIDKYGHKQYRDIPMNGIYEFVDSKTIDSSEYEF